MERLIHLPEPLVTGQIKEVLNSDHHHLARVLRVKAGDFLKVVDSQQQVFKGEILQVKKQKTMIEITAKISFKTEPPFELCLMQALPKGQRFEYILEKGCEIGVSTFYALQTERTVKNVPDQQETKKTLRWEKILKSSAQQSKRTKIPTVFTIDAIEKTADIIKKEDYVFLANEKSQQSLQKILAAKTKLPRGKIIIIIGPEGGFTDAELSYFLAKGARDISLGPRVLRSDTAGLVFSSILMYHFQGLEAF